uniref:Uncharacterized protein LOC113787807 n=1 Tax=Cicer arietinum TaxID=3827 RepID=A0A3Q7XWL0_CICAR|nr:uncharacterized protein LOC113787807 [Cicer arietinum]
MSFQEATVEHLVRRRLDHNLLLLSCHQTTCKDRCPFIFQAAWCTHSHYSFVVANAWNRLHENGGVDTALASEKEDSLKFNDEHFGNIFRRKELETILRGIQSTLEEFDFIRLTLLQNELL